MLAWAVHTIQEILEASHHKTPMACLYEIARFFACCLHFRIFISLFWMSPNSQVSYSSFPSKHRLFWVLSWFFSLWATHFRLPRTWDFERDETGREGEGRERERFSSSQVQPKLMEYFCSFFATVFPPTSRIILNTPSMTLCSQSGKTKTRVNLSPNFAKEGKSWLWRLWRRLWGSKCCSRERVVLLSSSMDQNTSANESKVGGDEQLQQCQRAKTNHR